MSLYKYLFFYWLLKRGTKHWQRSRKQQALPMMFISVGNLGSLNSQVSNIISGSALLDVEFYLKSA